jgi:hypothetical protein
VARPVAVLVAGAVEQAPDGRISLLGGGVGVLYSPELPSLFDRLGILVAIEDEDGASGHHQLQVNLRDPYGLDVLVLDGEASIARYRLPDAGLPPSAKPARNQEGEQPVLTIDWLAVQLPPLPLRRPGRYLLRVAVDEHELRTPLIIEGPDPGPSDADLRFN